MCNEAFNIAKNPKLDGYQRGLASIGYRFLDKKSALLADKSAYGGAVKIKIMSNKRPLDLVTQKTAEKLHKTTIGKFEKRKAYSPFIDNIWGADLVDTQSVSKFNNGIGF